MPKPLTHRKRINRYSLAMIARINAEATVRLKLIRRCYGHPSETIEITYHNGVKYKIRRVTCWGGFCECGCGQWARYPDRLEPHEKKTKAQGGVMSLDNTIMVLRACHERLQNSNPKLRWLKRQPTP